MTISALLSFFVSPSPSAPFLVKLNTSQQCIPQLPQLQVQLKDKLKRQHLTLKLSFKPPAAHHQIALLPSSVVHHLAAGTIITSLQTATAELVENAIDANSTQISLDITPTLGRITVTDNGHGISIHNGLLLAATLNATSKLGTTEQLDAGISTLGFRGQALWALATQASRGLTVSSKAHGALHGVRVCFDSHGRVEETAPVPMNYGTVVTVDGLPWGTNGAAAARQMRTCRAWIMQCSLVFPDISFRFMSQGKVKWRSGSGPRSRMTILAAMLRREVDEFREVSRDVAGVGKLEIVAGLPGRVQFSSRNWMLTAVNGRRVFVEGLNLAILKAFELGKGRYPAVFVVLNTGGVGVDWNVSPMKTHLRFRDGLEQRLIDTVSEMVGDLWQGVPEFEEKVWGAEGWGSPLYPAKSRNVLENLLSEQCAELEGGEESEEGDEGTIKARVVGQVLQVYIVVEHGGGIMLVEQHVADERVLYEKLLKNWKTQTFTRLEVPLQLPPQATDEWQFTLTTLGFKVEMRENEDDEESMSRYEVHSVPDVMCGLPELQQRAMLSRICRQAGTMEQAAAQLACNLATKNGKILSDGQMKEILRDWIKCKQRHVCPHGRNIAVQIGTRDLSRMFGRSWNPERMREDKVTGDAWTGDFVLGRSGRIVE